MAEKKPRLWTKDYALVLIMSMLQNAQMQMVNPIMTKYSVELGTKIGMVGVIVGVFSIAALCTRPVSGILADKIRSKPLVAVSAAGMGLATIGYSAVGADTVFMLILRILHGISFGICGTTLMRMASDLVEPSRMGEGMGLFGIGQVISMAIAPPVGIYISGFYGYGSAFLLSGAVVAMVTIMAFFISSPKTESIAGSKIDKVQRGRISATSIFNRLIAPEAVVFAVTACAICFCQSQETTFIVVYGESLGIDNPGLYFTVGAAAMLAVRLFSGRIMDKNGLNFIMIPSLLCIAAAMAMLGIAGTALNSFAAQGTFAIIIASAVVKAFGQGAAQPALQTACIQAVEKPRRGAASGTYYMGCDIGQGIGPIVGGAIASTAGYNGVYFVAAGVMMLGTLIFAVFVKRRA